MSWNALLSSVAEQVAEIGAEHVLFRGHSHADWKLLPGIARLTVPNKGAFENILRFDFATQAGSLLSDIRDSWSVLFAMQHHGLPTSLLDWTDTFAVALYFALRSSKESAAIWLLQPFEINRLSLGREELFHPHDVAETYESVFDLKKTSPFKIAAMMPPRHNPRIANQRGAFTLHVNLESPLEELYPAVVTKYTISRDMFGDAWTFLDLAGVNEFSLFPDLDGLSRKLKRQHLLV